MRRKIRHIRARNGEWVRVHRNPPAPASGQDALWWRVFQFAGGIFLFVIVCQIIKALLPFLVLGIIGRVALQCFSK
jgi:hypothetical protein